MQDSNVLKTGTTTVGIVCKEGIVLGSDKRATIGSGYVISHKADKIFTITDSIAVTSAGMVSDVQLLVKLLKAELKLKEMRAEESCSVREAANLLGRMVYQNIRKFSTIPGVSHFILGGKDDSGFHLYDVFPDGSVTECEDYLASGSGSIGGAYSILDAQYKKDMPINEAVNLCVKAINIALQRDVFSGDGIEIVTITKEGVKRVLTKDLRIKA